MFSVCRGQNEICPFFGLEADCRYKIEGQTLSHIIVKVNVCDDPISVTFNIKVNNFVDNINLYHLSSPQCKTVVSHKEICRKLRQFSAEVTVCCIVGIFVIKYDFVVGIFVMYTDYHLWLVIN